MIDLLWFTVKALFIVPFMELWPSGHIPFEGATIFFAWVDIMNYYIPIKIPITMFLVLASAWPLLFAFRIAEWVWSKVWSGE